MTRGRRIPSIRAGLVVVDGPLEAPTLIAGETSRVDRPQVANERASVDRHRVHVDIEKRDGLLAERRGLVARRRRGLALHVVLLRRRGLAATAAGQRVQRWGRERVAHACWNPRAPCGSRMVRSAGRSGRARRRPRDPAGCDHPRNAGGPRRRGDSARAVTRLNDGLTPSSSAPPAHLVIPRCMVGIGETWRLGDIELPLGTTQTVISTPTTWRRRSGDAGSGSNDTRLATRTLGSDIWRLIWAMDSPREMLACPPAASRHGCRHSNGRADAGHDQGMDAGVIDVWMQHPTLRHSQHEMFDSLRRWLGAELPTEAVPLEVTIRIDGRRRRRARAGRGVVRPRR